MIEFKSIIVLFVIVFIIISLYKNVFRPAVTFLIAIVILSVSGALTPHEVLVGFSNESIVVIIMLIIIGRVINKTSAMNFLFNKLFSAVRTYMGFLSKLMLGVAGSSAFINNTPIVAMLIPYVYDWGKRNKIAESKLLIPLSYASILGGCTTLIGTSTNLVVNGLSVESGLPSLNIFDFSYVGVPMLIIGIIYILIVGCKLLPEKRDAMEKFIEKPREYIVETVVLKKSPLIGKTVEEDNLRNLRGLFLVEIFRGNRKIAPVKPTEIIEEGDRLIFAGVTDTIVDLVNSDIGLSLPSSAVMGGQETVDVIEAVVSHNSNLTGKEVKEADFRANHDAAILAIHRNNEKLSGKIGEIKLQSGDVLLLLAGAEFWKKEEALGDMYVISKVKELHKVDKSNVIILLTGTILAIFLSAFTAVSLFQALLVLMAIIILLKIAKVSEIRRYIDLDLLAILGFALAMGKALINTGVAEVASDFMISTLQPFGTIGLLATIFIVTNILSAYITNKAAVAIIFPVALTVAISLNVNPVPFVLIVAYGGAASFITPIGYQTNLMVYGPGGYTFKDFLKIGFPLTLLYMVGSVAILGYIYKLY